MPVVKNLNNLNQENKATKIHLLLLEEHSFVASLEASSLTKAGFQVTLANSLDEMNKSLIHEKIDIVIMDYFFQRGKAVKEIKNAKLKSLNKNVRFVISSVQNTQEVKDISNTYHGDLFLVKPIARQSMIQELKKLAKQDFRKSVRTKCNIPFTIFFKNNIFQTFAIDISSEGSHLLDKENKLNAYVGMELNIEFMLPKTPELIKAKGIIVRITEEGFGLKFNNISKSDKHKIEDYISKNSLEVKSIHYYL
ncbi:response regulator [Silvanigrella paludirubra]|uniref:Response regulator n=1 Tax=Silvanigrella paludirubra TaxID=2499159 RepID=A0A6N6VSE1_9BACT|nr:PilZ domain-containing protein [Silvanigrella paludirubra]KAB8038013.1 response regulator [Silvanigrella paludirubra]